MITDGPTTTRRKAELAELLAMARDAGLPLETAEAYRQRQLIAATLRDKEASR